MSNRIVCAANMLSDGTILVGARHWDTMMANQLYLYLEAKGLTEEDWCKRERLDESQGFIDQFGKFYTRKEAYVVAEKENQIIRSIGYETDELYSEHLY